MPRPDEYPKRVLTVELFGAIHVTHEKAERAENRYLFGEKA